MNPNVTVWLLNLTLTRRPRWTAASKPEMIHFYREVSLAGKVIQEWSFWKFIFEQICTGLGVVLWLLLFFGMLLHCAVVLMFWQYWSMESKRYYYSPSNIIISYYKWIQWNIFMSVRNMWWHHCLLCPIVKNITNVMFVCWCSPEEEAALSTEVPPLIQM